jgi:hypothetical protein
LQGRISELEGDLSRLDQEKEALKREVQSVIGHAHARLQQMEGDRLRLEVLNSDKVNIK